MSVSASAQRYIGWDVGAWHCEGNTNSRDAITILDSSLEILGEPWRGNLRKSIASASSGANLMTSLHLLCGLPPPPGDLNLMVAIDTPLGFSEEFVALVGRRVATASPGTFETNRYLFRRTERYLFEHGIATPMSAVQDMIGSQATKGMHVLARFAPTVQECGVWGDGETLTVIEAYPSAARRSQAVADLETRFPPLKDTDRQDALVCALIAHLFVTQRDALIPPPVDVPVSEGWIWTPWLTSDR